MFVFFRRLPAVLLLFCLTALSGYAQTNQSNPTAELNITLGEQTVRFAPTRSFQEMRLEVVNSVGEIVFTYFTTEAIFDWNLRAGNSEALAPGLYRYALTLKFGENQSRQHTGHFIVEKTQDQVWLTASEDTEVSGTVLSASRNGGRSITGLGAKDDKSVKRDVNGREIVNEKGDEKGDKLRDDKDSAKAVKQEKAALLGTANMVAKYDVGGVNLIDSTITEVSGNVGIGTTLPGSILDMVRPGATDVVFRMANGTRGWSVGVSGTGDFWRIRDNTAGFARLVVTGGNGNVGIGNTAPAAKLDVTGSINATQYNVFGSRILHTTGTDNMFVGNLTGNANTTGAQNTFIGSSAGDSNTTGAKNTFVGEDAGGGNAGGSNNVFVGENAGLQNSSGSDNVAVGQSAGDTISTGDFNTMIGKNADVSLGGLTNVTAIGANAQVDASNSLVLGGINGVNSGTSVNVGIGTPDPKVKLHLLGDSQDHVTIRGTRIGSSSTYSMPTATLDGNNLMALEGNGHTGSGFSNPMAAIRLKASQDWAVGATGTYIAFETTANNTTTITERVRINANGTVEVNVLGGGGTDDVCRNGNKALSDCSSSRRYKDNILPFKAGLKLVSKLRPVTFDWKGGAADLGLVAEEVAAVEPLLTVYNDKGEIEGVKYKQLNVVLINAMKELQAQNTALLKRLETIERVLVRKKRQHRSR